MEPNCWDDTQLPTYRGRVIDENGAPVAGAAVTISQYENHTELPYSKSATSDDGSQRTASDAEGAFQLDVGRKAPRAREHYRKWNCAALADTGEQIGIGILRPGVEGTVALLPATSLRLRLTDTLGNPAAGVRIIPTNLRIDNQSYMLFRFVCPDRWQTPSDENGIIDWTGLPYGCAISAEVRDERYAPERLSIETEYAVDSTDRRIVVAAGGEIVGRVVFEPTGDPVPGIEVTVIGSIGDRSLVQLATATTDASGSYRLQHLVPASYRVDIKPPTDLAREWIARRIANLDVSDRQVTTAPDITLIRGGYIQGIVTYLGSGMPASRVRLGIQDHENTESAGFMTGDDGKFERLVPPGQNYRISLYPPHGHDTRTVAVEAGMTASVAFSVREPRKADVPDTVTRSVTGRVLDMNGQPAAGVTVTAVAQYGRQLHRITSAQGRYRFDNLDQFDAIFELFAVQGRFAAHVVRDVPSDDSPVDLSLAPNTLGTVSGKVIDPEGRPVADATVSLVSYRWGIGKYIADVQTDTLGRYVIDPIFVDGQYELAVSAPGFGDASFKLRPLIPNQTRKKAALVLQRSTDLEEDDERNRALSLTVRGLRIGSSIRARSPVKDALADRYV